ncbi:MAG: hypothetical protein WC068_07305 [Caulobacter sp.]
MRTRPSLTLRLLRLALAMLATLVGGGLLVSTRITWRAAPAFLPADQFRPSAWTAFNGGLSVLALALIALALAAGWRTVNDWRAAGEPAPARPAGGAFLATGLHIPLPRYGVDVAICLAFCTAVLVLPVLAVGGPPELFLGFAWTSLTVINLIAGALLGAVRR